MSEEKKDTMKEKESAPSMKKREAKMKERLVKKVEEAKPVEPLAEKPCEDCEEVCDPCEGADKKVVPNPSPEPSQTTHKGMLIRREHRKARKYLGTRTRY